MRSGGLLPGRNNELHCLAVPCIDARGSEVFKGRSVDIDGMNLVDVWEVRNKRENMAD